MKPRYLVVMALALALLLVATVAALAAEDTKQVGLVIAFPDGATHSEVVTVPVTATTYDVLASANIQLIGTVAQFGPAVCSINRVGCAASNCFCDAKHFWAFYHLDKAANKWVAAQEGVGAAVPANGAVEGFAWSEMDASFNPITQPPVTTFEQIAGQSARPAASAPPQLPPTGAAGAAVWAAVLALALVLAGVLLGRAERAT